MDQQQLKPWGCMTWLSQGLVLLFAGCAWCVSGLFLFSLPTLKAHILTKAIIVVLAACAAAFPVAMFMWSRYWRRVAWDNAWGFIVGPMPEYEDARQAWRWGRRVLLIWVVTLACVFSAATIEALRHQ